MKIVSAMLILAAIICCVIGIYAYNTHDSQVPFSKDGLMTNSFAFGFLLLLAWEMTAVIPAFAEETSKEVRRISEGQK